LEISTQPILWPFLVYGLAVIALAAFMLGLSHFLGERHKDRATDETFEAGIKMTGTGRVLFPIHFYVIAMFFVVFDLETVFIVTWAVSAKALGWAGYLAILTFVVDLLAVLIYVWRIGALDFGPNGKKILKAYHKIKANNQHEVVDN